VEGAGDEVDEEDEGGPLLLGVGMLTKGVEKCFGIDLEMSGPTTWPARS
jgi:hypothetical protein